MAERKIKKLTGAKTFQCSCCGLDLLIANFYISHSFLNRARGRLTICKTCIDELYNEVFLKTKNHKIAMYRLCRKLDIPYLSEVFNMAYKEAESRSSKLYGIYFQKMNSLGARHHYNGDFDDSEMLDYDDVMVNEEYEDIQKGFLKGFEVTPEMILFWGANLKKEDYWFLSEQYAEWNNTYELDSKSLQELVKQICFTQMKIDTKRAMGDNVDKDLDTYQKLLTSCNFKPNQENMMNSAEQATFGTLIKRWENEKPIPKPDPEWKDVDGIMKYVKVWFTGHLAKMMGVETEFTSEYEEEIAKYTVDEGY
jgi:hypothetical protein